MISSRLRALEPWGSGQERRQASPEADNGVIVILALLSRGVVSQRLATLVRTPPPAPLCMCVRTIECLEESKLSASKSPMD